ncbi:hypothetical protein NMY22_g5712 [Coprinellus aureogranulatus]|nr:hypothetical protein NMY22_g5712 [Coprinellus aureogranulatus]
MAKKSKLKGSLTKARPKNVSGRIQSRGTAFVSLLSFGPLSCVDTIEGVADPREYGRGLVTLNATEDDLVFQATHLEEDEEDGEGVVDIYGVFKDGCPALLTVADFCPYFYCLAPKGFNAEDCEPFKDHVNALLQLPDAVCEIGLHTKRTSSSGAPQIFIKVTLRKPSRMARAKDESLALLNRRSTLTNTLSAIRLFSTREIQYRGLFHAHPPMIYECDVPFVSRFMADMQIMPMTWVKVPRGQYTLTTGEDRISTLRVEARTSCEYIKACSNADKQRYGLPAYAPLRVLSFDIETMVPADESFPQPGSESVIQISSVVGRRCYALNHPAEEFFFRCVFTLNSCAAIPGCTIFPFNTEAELLNGWRRFIINMDPDIIMGHNIFRFDLPYLLLRAKHLNLEDFSILGRLQDVSTTYDHPFQSPTQDGWAIAPFFPGRVAIDTLHWALQNLTGSCSLNTLASRFLDDAKDGVSFRDIVRLQNGTAETRKRLAQYCLQDAQLVLRLADNRGSVQSYIHRARNGLLTLNSVVSASTQLVRLLTSLHQASGRYIIQG